MPKKTFDQKTGFGKFLATVGQELPSLAGTIVNVAAAAASGNITGAISTLAGALHNTERDSPDSGHIATQLIKELKTKGPDFEAELARLETEDRKSARTREVDLRKAGGNNWLMNVVAVIILAAFCYVLYAVVNKELPNKGIFEILLGMLSSAVMAIVYYYFGTSHSSSRKTELMQK